MRSADDTNLSDCVAIAGKDKKIIWEELGDLEGRLNERNGWILTVMKSKVEAHWLEVAVKEKGPELVYLSTVVLRATAVVVYLRQDVSSREREVLIPLDPEQMRHHLNSCKVLVTQIQARWVESWRGAKVPESAPHEEQRKSLVCSAEENKQIHRPQMYRCTSKLNILEMVFWHWGPLGRNKPCPGWLYPFCWLGSLWSMLTPETSWAFQLAQAETLPLMFQQLNCGDGVFLAVFTSGERHHQRRKKYSSWRKSWHKKKQLLHGPEQVWGRNYRRGVVPLYLGVHACTHLHRREGNPPMGWPLHSKMVCRLHHQDSCLLELLTSVLWYQMP